MKKLLVLVSLIALLLTGCNEGNYNPTPQNQSFEVTQIPMDNKFGKVIDMDYSYGNYLTVKYLDDNNKETLVVYYSGNIYKIYQIQQ